MKPRQFVAIVTATLVAACGLTANTRISASDGVAAHPYRKIAVISMSATKSERQTFDDALVAGLAAVGVDGIVGDRYIEDAATANGIAPMDAIRAAGADGVIYVWLHSEGAKSGADPLPGNWGSVAAWYAPTQTEPATRSKFEARLYDVHTQGMVWSGDTTTFYPGTLAIDAPHVAEAIVGELAKRGFVATRH